MKTTEYLYDCKPSEFADMIYKDAIEFKKDKAQILFLRLMKQEDEFYKDGKKYDDVADLRLRIRDVGDAVSHNEKLIEELKGTEK